MSAETKSSHRLTAERNTEAILDAAERLLRRNLEPSFAAIAGEAGVSRPTVYAHFAGRSELTEALVERTVKRTTAAMLASELQTGPPPQALERMLSTSWEKLAHHQEIAEAAAAELGAAAMRRSHAVAHRAVTELIERGQQDGTWRTDLSPQWLATCTLGLVHTAFDQVHARTMSKAAALQALQATVQSLLRPPRAGE